MTNTMTKRLYYDANEVASILGISKPTLTVWLERGKVPPCIRPGGPNGKRLWVAAEIDKFLEGLKVPSSGRPTV